MPKNSREGSELISLTTVALTHAEKFIALILILRASNSECSKAATLTAVLIHCS